MTLRDRFFGQEWSDENVDFYDVKSSHVITAQIKAEDIRMAKAIFKDILNRELNFQMLPSDRIYAEDDEFGNFRCILIVTSKEHYP